MFVIADYVRISMVYMDLLSICSSCLELVRCGGIQQIAILFDVLIPWFVWDISV